MSDGYQMRLKSGVPLNEAASALQKAIRRGHEEVAFWWAKSIADSGYHAYAWKRLAVIASEDVGNADPLAAILVSALWSSWRGIWEQQGKKTLPNVDLLAQAVLYLCRARKTREADELVNYVEELEKTSWEPQVPHYALDAHTDRGREKLRKAGVKQGDPAYWEMWWGEGTKLAGAGGVSRYHSRLAAYGGRGGQPQDVDESVHFVDRHECDRCGCLGDVTCNECEVPLCLGHAVPCSGLCGRYFCHEHAVKYDPGLMCMECSGVRP